MKWNETDNEMRENSFPSNYMREPALLLGGGLLIYSLLVKTSEHYACLLEFRPRLQNKGIIFQ